MDILMQWGINIILALQSVPGWTGVMKFYSLFGTEEFFLVVMPVLYWCVDSSVGLQVGVALIASGSLNSLLKVAFHLPRPYWVDQRVLGLGTETSYGLPSGHAMASSTLWGLLAAHLKRWWTWAAALVLIGLVSLSRLYLGVHFPTDVLAGWVFGALVLAAVLVWERPLAAMLEPLSVGQQIGLAFAVSAAYLALYDGVLALLAATPDPAAWAQTAALAGVPRAGQLAIDPRNPADGVTGAGLIFGLGASLALLAHRPCFLVRGPWRLRALRVVVGAAGVLVLWLGLALVTPAQPFIAAAVMRYIRYSSTVFWALYLAPLAFIRLGLAEAA
jgi:membrane-associated phospholipid phosphatase